MAKGYRHIQEYEREILELRKQDEKYVRNSDLAKSNMRISSQGTIVAKTK